MIDMLETYWNFVGPIETEFILDNSQLFFVPVNLDSHFLAFSVFVVQLTQLFFSINVDSDFLTFRAFAI
jgi:hypothetical protein